MTPAEDDPAAPTAPTLEESRAAIENLRQTLGSDEAAEAGADHGAAPHPEAEGETTNPVGPASDPVAAQPERDLPAHDLRGTGIAAPTAGSDPAGPPS